MPLFPTRARLTGAEPPLRDLVRDVLAEAGVDLAPEGAADPSAVVVLVPGGEPGVAEEVRKAVARAAPAPVLVLLPYPDDRQAQQALAAGALGVVSLWGSLGALRTLVADVLARRPLRRPAGGEG